MHVLASPRDSAHSHHHSRSPTWDDRRSSANRLFGVDGYDFTLEIRCYAWLDSEAVLAVPYTPKSDGPFRVHKPRLIAWNNCEDFDLNRCMESFFNGVAGHEEGAAIWNACLDESK